MLTSTYANIYGMQARPHIQKRTHIQGFAHTYRAQGRAHTYRAQALTHTEASTHTHPHIKITANIQHNYRTKECTEYDTTRSWASSEIGATLRYKGENDIMRKRFKKEANCATRRTTITSSASLSKRNAKRLKIITKTSSCKYKVQNNSKNILGRLAHTCKACTPFSNKH